ncbi:energy-coupled thiamine transporter ThiT [Faecalimonas umbilicata]|uniref:energy-coupled thiamine transporter ThiT n=1 Tax=Faecalimonas umbilicata TaxID=1912855 RepID=UPI000E403FD7|nr:energy-coupled thiamine transporter ThiT [Faecalimonas umbilicata]RGC78401.1 energy-coupled thiamine transporter ThiT [Lachnospiraceae bacterium AM25-17]RJU66825.1 energy-coupled thiamine transporter ThiT [Coprococcus sp. AM27-12LB]
MSFFVTKADGTYSLTTAGYVAVAVILVALIVVAALFAKREKKEKKKIGTKQLVVCAMAVALAMVTSMLKIYSFPFGGSVTLFSMLFICFVGYLYGPATGMLTGAAYGVLQLLIEPYIYFPLQVLVDYPLAFGALGLSGCFSKSKHGLVKGYLFGVLARYVFAVISGWLFFGEYAWDGWAALPYSLVYNGCYIFAEAALTVLVLSIPAVSKAMKKVKITAVN